jgi:hypothetical protein
MTCTARATIAPCPPRAASRRVGRSRSTRRASSSSLDSRVEAFYESAANENAPRECVGLWRRLCARLWDAPRRHSRGAEMRLLCHVLTEYLVGAFSEDFAPTAVARQQQSTRAAFGSLKPRR